MPHPAFQLAPLCLALLLPMVGCSRSIVAESPAVIAQDQYEPTLKASIDVLREFGLRVARNDYRFGVITTYPEESPTLAEPWVGLNTTRDQARRSTLNAERRVVMITLRPTEVFADDSTRTTPYELTVKVEVQRLRDATRYLTRSARGDISAHYLAVPAHLEDRGVEAQSWQSIGRDAALEQRLIAAIIERTEHKIIDREARYLQQELSVPRGGQRLIP